jgi:hypothetical protein
MSEQLVLSNILIDFLRFHPRKPSHDLIKNIVKRFSPLTLDIVLKLIGFLYINQQYNQFNKNVNFLDWRLELPVTVDDMSTKIARLALDNLINYLLSIGLNVNSNDYKILYIQFLEDLAQQSNFNISEYQRFNCKECEVIQGKHLIVKRNNILLK